MKYIQLQQIIQLHFNNLRITNMGEEHSKTTSDQSTIDSSSTFSQTSNSQKSQSQPISCSYEKFKKLPKSKKIKTTCVLKSPYKSQNSSLCLQIVKPLNSFEISLIQINSYFKEQIERTLIQTQKVYQISNCHQKKQNILDIDRIDSFFNSYLQSQINLNFEFCSNQKQTDIQRWKNSVNKIMKDIQQFYQYRQGQLMICSIMRLFFKEQITVIFMKKLLQKCGHIFCNSQKFIQFSNNLDQRFKLQSPLLLKKLEQNELDFKFLYTSWVLGMFSCTLPQKTCIKIWFDLCQAQNPTKYIEELLAKMILSIQQNIVKQELRQCINNEKKQGIELTNQTILKLLDITTIELFISRQNANKINNQNTA